MTTDTDSSYDAIFCPDCKRHWATCKCGED